MPTLGNPPFPAKTEEPSLFTSRGRSCRRWVVRTGKNTGDKIAGATIAPREVLLTDGEWRAPPA
jgi:hypothetical protein